MMLGMACSSHISQASLIGQSRVSEKVKGAGKAKQVTSWFGVLRLGALLHFS